MINAKELRIGNWVNAKFMTDDFNFQVAGIRSYGGPEGWAIDASHISAYHENTLHGIPLTEEWLIKAQFDEQTYSNCVECEKWVGDFKLKYRILKPKNLTEFWLEGNGMYDEAGEMDLTDICKYVHQLQNLYFALTGEELKITNQ